MANVYRPPKLVVEESGLAEGPMSLDEVSKLFEKSTGETRRWARRILRQNGQIAVAKTGDVMLPEYVDYQLGPEILAAVTASPLDTVTDHLAGAGVRATCVPVEKGTLVLMTCSEEVEKLGDKLLDTDSADWDEADLVEENLNKARSFLKSGDGEVVGFDCWELSDYRPEIDLKWSEAYLLVAKDVTETEVEILKVDEELGVVIGWGIICTIKDNPYFDKQGDHVPDNSMLEATIDFMIHSRVGGEMHARTVDQTGEQVPVIKGAVVCAWPMTREIAKAFGIETDITGLMVAFRPDDDEILEKFKDGTYTGFSIGGHRILDEEVPDGEAS